MNITRYLVEVNCTDFKEQIKEEVIKRFEKEFGDDCVKWTKLWVCRSQMYSELEFSISVATKKLKEVYAVTTISETEVVAATDYVAAIISFDKYMEATDKLIERVKNDHELRKIR